MNALRVLNSVKNREQRNGEVTRNMQYTNGAWNDSHRK